MKYIKNITAWISDMKPGEVKSAYLPCDRVQTLNCLASRFNPNRSLGFLCVVRQREIL